MATVSVNFRLDKGLKESFEEFCAASGLTVTAALTLFVSKTVREGRIPFEIGPGRPLASARRISAYAEALHCLREPQPDPDGLKDGWASNAEGLLKEGESK